MHRRRTSSSPESAGDLVQGWRGRARRAAVLLTMLLGSAAATAAQPAPGCVQAGEAAAIRAGLPRGLLLAVGRVETGRVDPASGDIVPWPWAIDVAGQAHFFPDKQAAVRVTRALLASGQRNIDVGCYQISLLHHPFAFSDLAQAFDPAANATYAARFLASLHSRYGNWAGAVAAYHSADPARGDPYRALVFAQWRPQWPPRQNGWAFPSVPGVHVWTPSAPGTAPQVIRLRGGGRANAPLPRVIALSQ